MEITPELIELVLSINKQDMFLYEEMEKRLIHKIKAKIQKDHVPKYIFSIVEAICSGRSPKDSNMFSCET